MGASARRRDEEFSSFASVVMPDLYRQAWLLCGDRGHAEDLVQETLIKVYGRWGDRIETPAAYARTTLTRTWISNRRKRSNHERPHEKTAEMADLLDGGRGGAAGEVTELRATLVPALSALEPMDRAVVVLRYLYDLSIRDVSGMLELSDSAVRSRSLRALRSLRASLGTTIDELVPEGAA